ncbi:MAG TPA: nitroreductase/quinone reductase family protein [Anaerolineales bacterium]|nr:nitroreductase/quinone reductase family protein [Anaerolineales bacterium]HMV94952.1 nitroreductase/quinone reductase family protein [Anaerolineales bacterium]HMX18739.1 nitroreductase/quinone reductase family protein [Anaerolineales bacterium]HMX73788.1 nitroreductase/quinone reductase family protein [Anaerolineales bacterium]HMZ42146.1 nitroreductase/quinone reductase family protein [Anaerolineales bacterium]
MTIKPNFFQKFVHRFLMMRWVSAFLAVSLHRLDAIVLKLSRGRHTVTELVGLPIIQITTIGAKSGEPRTMPLVSLFDGEKIALIGSNFGRQHNPGWYYNLKANPQCVVQTHGREQKFIARQAVGEEREKYWQMAVSYYKGYELYKVRAAHRQIPVMVLEPMK